MVAIGKCVGHLMAEAPAMHAVLSQRRQLVTCMCAGTTVTCI